MPSDKEQQNLLQKNKKEELGELIASISHQWRDGLNKIASINLEKMMKMRLGQPLSEEELLKSFQEIDESIAFMSKTMQDFLDFYKPSASLAHFDAKESLHAARNIIDTKLKQSNTVLEVIELHEISIEAVKNEWVQIWLNLLNNSIKEAQKRGIAEPRISVKLTKEKILYYDNCGAIEPEILQKLQHRTHEGIGVKIIYDILEKSGWSLQIGNSEIGAVFTLVKPKV
ncbi:MAG: hypothetical protein AB7U24_09100 [Sulfurimonadaceae bacterium]